MKRLLLFFVILTSVVLLQHNVIQTCSVDEAIELGETHYIMNDDVITVTVYECESIEHLEGIKVAATEISRTPDGPGG